LIDWQQFEKATGSIEEKKALIENEGADRCLEALLLHPPASNPEMAEWALAFTKYFE
jgi:hypothetical protein